MRRSLLAVCCAAVFAVHPLAAQNRANGQTSAPASSQAAAQNSTAVKTGMKNVEFHLTDNIVMHIVALNGRLTPLKGEMPVFDDKKSFALDVDSATVVMSPAALTNDLNDYVFAGAEAPLKKLTVEIKGDQLVVKGLLVSKGGVPFESDGTVSATPDGKIRVHTTKVKALKLEVKGLMDLLGLDTQKLIDTQKVPGVSTDKDDLILDPEQILPPPAMRGHLTGIRIENDAIMLAFGPPASEQRQEGIATTCGGRNYVQFRGGSIRFGKLTMADTDLELIDTTPNDPFDFAIDHYQDELVAGYIKATKSGGMCAYIQDYNKLHHEPARKYATAKSAAPSKTN
ncbi:MAG: hypothetical protein WA823_18050 [Candidatus Acidiferrales bacterium]